METKKKDIESFFDSDTIVSLVSGRFYLVSCLSIEQALDNNIPRTSSTTAKFTAHGNKEMHLVSRADSIGKRSVFFFTDEHAVILRDCVLSVSYNPMSEGIDVEVRTVQGYELQKRTETLLY